jgi:Ca2+-binding RTX toxin-like protein
MRRVVLVLAAMALALLLASGVAWAVNKIGTDGPDTLRGTNRADNLSGEGANDDLLGLGGSDNLLGGAGKDNVLGGNERRPQGGDKNLVGGPANDRVLGGNGSDNAVGGPGNDFVDGGRGSDRVVGEGGSPDVLIDGPFREASQDTLSGGDGGDLIVVDNGPAFGDLVTCGRGFDRVAADRKDVVADDCEEVAVGRAAIEELFESLPPGTLENFEEGLPPFPE